ncbi:hypothetical protein OG218_09145 [Kineococcus sp. NBC_00420]|uniref:hypothetical protein n=1 Tax=Kineococcus sp. NBC_00420 TaxID=2903564 RepID=UPI002E1C2EFD
MLVLTEHVARLTEQVSALVEHLGGAPAPTLMTCAQVAELLGVTESWEPVKTSV